MKFYVIESFTVIGEYSNREDMLKSLDGMDIKDIRVIEGEERKLIEQPKIIMKGNL